MLKSIQYDNVFDQTKPYPFSMVSEKKIALINKDRLALANIKKQLIFDDNNSCFIQLKMKNSITVYCSSLFLLSGLEIKFFFREPNCIFKSFQKALCIETSTFFGSLQKFEGAAGEFKGALGSWHPLISSPVYYIFFVM